MKNPIDDHLEEITSLCREFGVARLELFGSAATGEFDPDRSDIDFLVEYPEGYDFGPFLKNHQEFHTRLEKLLGFSVDLVMPGGLRNPFLIVEIERSRTLLYAA